VLVGMLLATDAMVVAIGSLQVFAGRLHDPAQRAAVGNAIAATESQVREVRRRIHRAARQ
jgi:hypothetical protein